jgi:hypothetical protein
MRARLVRVDGSTEMVDLPGDSSGNLTAMYKAMGCDCVDVIRLVQTAPGCPGLDMWIDDNGMFTKEPNVIATILAAAIDGGVISQPVFGDVLLTGGADSEGDTLPLTSIQDAVLRDMVADAHPGGIRELALTN